MDIFQPIEFHRTRDFSKKMNVTFEFVRQNWKGLGKSILFIAGPPVLVASLIVGSFFGDLISITQTAANGAGDSEGVQTYFMSVSFWLQIILAMIFFIISSVMTIATINNYIVLYGEKQSNQIEVNEVWERVRDTFWMYFSTTLFFAIIIIGLYLLMILPVVLLAAISPALIFLGILGLMCALLYIVISISLIFIVRSYEHRNFFDAFRRSFSLVHGKWWSTFGLMMVLYLIMTTISYIPVIPLYATIIVTALHNTSTDTAPDPSSLSSMLTIVFFTLYYMAQMILSALPNIGIAFQYFNLVEMKEAKGLLDKIDTFGNPTGPPSAPDERY
ncbi:MAG TPA: hypothetical protein VK666_15220 [Chryseolinea sp.]|nr:hypothetical protein [Chryseolinea sp.]